MNQNLNRSENPRRPNRNSITIRSFSYTKNTENPQVKQGNFPRKINLMKHYVQKPNKFPQRNKSSDQVFHQSHQNFCSSKSTMFQTHFFEQGINKYDTSPWQQPKSSKLPFCTNFLHEFRLDGKPVINYRERIPSELEIQKHFRFKLPVLPSSFDSVNLQTHLLESFPNQFYYMQLMIGYYKLWKEKFIKEKDQIKQRIEELKTQYQQTIDSISNGYVNKFQQFTNNLKEDFINNQNESF